MISIQRIAPDPNFLKDPETSKLKRELTGYFDKQDSKTFSQSRFDFEKIRKHLFKKLSVQLNKDFNSKCCYCETRIEKGSFENIEHFRPSFSAEGFGKESFAPLHYWWLTFEWSNIYYACEECRRYKGHWFPVLDHRARLKASSEAIKAERNVIIDPCSDKNVEWKFSYSKEGRVLSAPTRTRSTIDLLSLNRPELLKNRKAHYAKFKLAFDEWIKSFKSTVSNRGKFNQLTDYLNVVLNGSSAEEYLGMKQFFFYKWIKMPANEYVLTFITSKTVPKHLSFADTKVDQLFLRINSTQNRITANLERVKKIIALGGVIQEKKIVQGKNYYIKSIEIKNFKSIASLKFVVPPNKTKTPWLMLLGENGVGKSSTLQAIALALTDPLYQDEVLNISPSSFIKHNTRSGSVKIEFEGEDRPLHIQFTRKLTRTVSEPDNFFFPPTTFLAYGSTRLLPDPGIQWEKDFGLKNSDSISRIKNLFVPSCALYNSEEWLLETYKKDRQDFNFAALAIKSLIDLDTEIDLYNKEAKPGASNKSGLLLMRARDEENKFRIYVTRGGRKYLLNQLSDGYQSVIALSVDIMRSLFKLNTDMNNANAIILIDEIGTHLHPRWKMRVVASLRKAFPRVQFIVTTHDPLCLKGIEDKEVVVLRTDASNDVQLISDLPDPAGLRADQLLTSEFFGLSSTIDPETERKFTRYYYLKGLPPANLRKIKNGTKEMEELEAQLRIDQNDSRHLGDSLREEIVYHVIDELLAKKMRMGNKKSTADIKSDAVKRVQSLWGKLEKQDNHDQG